jgi:nitroreductase
MVEQILSRRSIRDGFAARDVPDEVVEQILACGLAAPSSKNAQPWRIHVVTDGSTLAEAAEAVQGAKRATSYVPIDPATGRPRPDWPSTVAESAGVLRQVGLGLFIENSGRFSDGRRNIAQAADEVREHALVGYSFEMIGIGAAVQNMWLAAQSLGLAGVFMGDVLIAESWIRERLGMVGDLVGVLAIGYSDGGPAPRRLAPDRVVVHRPRVGRA